LGVLRALSIQPYFDAVLVSETERVRKPDRAMFDRAARRLHAFPHECIFVGDHSVVDIQGAREAGWRTIWKRTNIWDAPTVMDATIDGYDELVDAVEAIKIVSVLPVKYPQPD
jgi:putative hydrolase of the HAD superfamily